MSTEKRQVVKCVYFPVKKHKGRLTHLRKKGIVTILHIPGRGRNRELGNRRKRIC